MSATNGNTSNVTLTSIHTNTSRDGLRRQSSNSVPTWHCGGSVDRCRICGGLGQCPCRKEHRHHIDPQVRQQNLRALLHNTPFERKRLLRERQESIDKILIEESRCRDRLYDTFAGTWHAMMLDMYHDQHFTMVYEDAMNSIFRLFRTEQQERAAIVAFKKSLAPSITLACVNQLDRLEIASMEEREKRKLMRFHINEVIRIDTKDQEQQRRHAIVTCEAERRGHISAMLLGVHSSFREHECEREVLQRCHLVGRDDIVQDECAAWQRMGDAFERGVHCMAARAQERHEFAMRAEKFLIDFSRASERELKLKMESMEEELELVAERVRRKEIAIGDFFASERRRRTSLESDERDCFSELQCERMAHAADCAAAEAQRMTMVKETVADALDNMSTFGEACVEQLALLLSRCREEAVLVDAWAVERERARAQALEDALDGKNSIFLSDVTDMKVLWESMIEEGHHVMQWIQQKKQERQQFIDHVFAIHPRQLLEEQTAIRSELWQRMQDEEDMLYAWLDELDSERNSTVCDEMCNRHELETLEERRRMDMKQRFDSRLEAWMAHASRIVDEQRALLRQATMTLAAVERDESTALDILLRLEDENFAFAFDEQCFREMCELSREEEAYRQEIIVSELRFSESLLRRSQSEQREVIRRLAEYWQSYFTATELNEAQMRLLLTQEENANRQVLIFDAGKDLEIAGENETIRLDAERRAKQVYLLEEARSYDAAEEPIAEGRMSLAEFRRSVQLDPTSSSGRKTISFVDGGSCSSRRSTRQPVAVVDEEALRREFISQAVGGYDVSRLAPEAITLFAGIIDLVNNKKLAAEATWQQISKEVEMERKRETTHKKELENLKNTCQDYAAKFNKSVQDGKHRRQQHKERLAREDQSIALEQKRLQQHLKAQKQMEEKILETKEMIQKTYQRR